MPDTIFVLIGFAATIAGICLVGTHLAPGVRSGWCSCSAGSSRSAGWNYLAGITVYLNHTHPELPWFDKERRGARTTPMCSGTMHVKMPIDIFPLYTDVMAHPAHHSNVQHARSMR